MIRTATREDVPALVAMGERFADSPDYRLVLRNNPDQLAITAEMLVTSEIGTMLVLESDRQLVGMIGMVCMPHFLSGELFAGEVCWWVDPEHRGGGLRLMKAAEAWALARGALTIQMIAPNARVGQLYERLGYTWTESMYQKACPHD